MFKADKGIVHRRSFAKLPHQMPDRYKFVFLLWRALGLSTVPPVCLSRDCPRTSGMLMGIIGADIEIFPSFLAYQKLHK